MIGQSEDHAIESLQAHKSFADIAKILPPNRQGRPVNVATIWRWKAKGFLSSDGVTRIKLRAVRSPNGWKTTAEWVNQFFEALAADKDPSTASAPTIRSTSTRRREIERAERRLTAAGIV